VATIARRYTDVAELDELIGYGNVALVEAVDAYDPERGKFAPFAWNRIKGAMIRGTTQQHRPIRLPEYQENRIRATETARERLTQEYGRAPTDAEIAATTGLSVSKVREDDDANDRTRWLVEPDEDEDAYKPAVYELPVWVTESPEKTAQLLRIEERATIARAALDRLPDKEREIFTLRHTGEERGRAWIADKLGVSEREVKTALQRARRVLDRDPAVIAEQTEPPAVPAQVPKPAKATPRPRRAPAPVVRYTLPEAERAALLARCDAKYRERIEYEVPFDLAAWRAGAAERKRERIAQAWRDVAELERLSRPTGQMRYTTRPPWETVDEQRDYVRALKAGRQSRTRDPNAPLLTNGEVRKLKAQRHSDILCELVARPRIITRHEREAASVSPEDPCVTIYMTRDVLAVGRGHVPLFRRAHSPVN